MRYCLNTKEAISIFISLLSFLPRNNKFVKLFIAISFANNVILNIDKTNCSHHINIYFFGRNSNVIKIRISDNVEHSAFCG